MTPHSLSPSPILRPHGLGLGGSSRPTFRSRAWALAILAALPAAQAADVTASLLTGGDWNDAAIWSTDPVVPNNGAQTFDVIFDVGDTLNLNVPITIERLAWTAGTLTGAQALTLNDALTWSDGTLETTLNAHGGGTFSGWQYLDSGTLNTAGTFTLSGSGIYGYSASTIANSGTWNNTADSQLTRAPGDLTLYHFNNSGTFTKSGGTGTTSIDWTFNNSGTVNANSGTLGLTGGGTSSGNFVVGPGGILSFDGTHDLSGNISGAGKVELNGTVNLNGGTHTAANWLVWGDVNVASAATVNLGSLEFSGGTIAGEGVVGVSGPLTWSDGTLETTLNAHGGGTFSGWQSLDGGTLNTAGTFTLSGNGIYGYSASTIANSGTWNNTVDSQLTRAPGDLTLYHFNNSGTFTKSGGTGTTSIDWTFNNSGTVNANSGTLGLAGGGTSSGNFVVGPGGILSFDGTHDLSGNISGAGKVELNGTVNLNGGTHTAANWLVWGDVNVASAATVNLGSLEFSGGTIAGEGVVGVSGPLTWSDGILETTLNANGGGTFSGWQSLDGGTLNTAGTFTLSGSGIYGYSASTIANSGIWNNTADSQLTRAPGDLTLYHFNNSGTFTKSGGTGATWIQWTFNNSGTVNADSGTLGLWGGGTSSGNFVVGPGGILSFDGTHDLSGNISGAGKVELNGTVNLNGGTHTAANWLVWGDVNVASAATVNMGSLEFKGGTITGEGVVGVSGPLTWSDGILESTLNAHGGGTFSGWQSLDGGTLNTAGTFTLSGSGIYGYSASTIANSGTWNNTADSQLTGGPGDLSLHHFNNSGTFTKSGGTGATGIQWTFNNSGTVNANSGTLSFDQYVQSAGILLLDGGKVAFSAPAQLEGGLLTGFGTIDGSVDASGGGSISPGLSPGDLNITGDLTLGTGSFLTFELAGTERGVSYDALDVAGTLTLAGVLQVDLLNGYLPGAGDSFVLATAGDVSGNFANILNGGRLSTVDGFGSFLVQYGGAVGDTIRLSQYQAVPEPHHYMLVSGLGLAGFAWFRRRFFRPTTAV